MTQDMRLDPGTVQSSPARADQPGHAAAPGGSGRGEPAEVEEIASAQRDPHAFAPLYERYVDAIFGYCYRRTGDREGAADLTSQIFARALAALSRYRIDGREGTFRSWLFAIAHNLVIDARRTRRDHHSLDRLPGGRPLHDPARSPEDEAIAGEDRRSLMQALERLSGPQRQVVELRLAGLTGPEIAAVLGMRLPAVKSAQFRAYARLRDLLQADVHHDPARPIQEPPDA